MFLLKLQRFHMWMENVKADVLDTNFKFIVLKYSPQIDNFCDNNIQEQGDCGKMKCKLIWKKKMMSIIKVVLKHVQLKTQRKKRYKKKKFYGRNNSFKTKRRKFRKEIKKSIKSVEKYYQIKKWKHSGIRYGEMKRILRMSQNGLRMLNWSIRR